MRSWLHLECCHFLHMEGDLQDWSILCRSGASCARMEHPVVSNAVELHMALACMYFYSDCVFAEFGAAHLPEALFADYLRVREVSASTWQIMHLNPIFPRTALTVNPISPSW